MTDITHFEIRIVDKEEGQQGIRYWPAVPSAGDIIYLHYSDHARRMKVDHVTWDHVDTSGCWRRKPVVSLVCDCVGKEVYHERSKEISHT